MLSIGHTANNLFAVCTNGKDKTHNKDTTHGKDMFCRVLFLAHGKEIFCRVFFVCF